MTEPIGEPIADETGTVTVESETDRFADVADDDEVPTDMKAIRELRGQNKRLRMRLREAEANRVSVEELRARDLARLAEYERRAVEAAASTVLVDPEDVWRHTDETTQAEFNDEFGSIVADNVIAAAKKLAAERPHLAKPNAAPPPSDRPIEGLRPGAAPEAKPKPTSWAAAIRGTRP